MTFDEWYDGGRAITTQNPTIVNVARTAWLACLEHADNILYKSQPPKTILGKIDEGFQLQLDTLRDTIFEHGEQISNVIAEQGKMNTYGCSQTDQLSDKLKDMQDQIDRLNLQWSRPVIDECSLTNVKKRIEELWANFNGLQQIVNDSSKSIKKQDIDLAIALQKIEDKLYRHTMPQKPKAIEDMTVDEWISSRRAQHIMARIEKLETKVDELQSARESHIDIIGKLKRDIRSLREKKTSAHRPEGRRPSRSTKPRTRSGKQRG